MILDAMCCMPMFTRRQRVVAEVHRLEQQLNEVHAAHVTSKQNMEKEVRQLTKQLGVDVGAETTMVEVVKEETDKVE